MCAKIGPIFQWFIIRCPVKSSMLNMGVPVFGPQKHQKCQKLFPVSSWWHIPMFHIAIESPCLMIGFITPIEKGSAFQKLCGFMYAAPPVSLVYWRISTSCAWYVSIRLYGVSVYQLCPTLFCWYPHLLSIAISLFMVPRYPGFEPVLLA